MLIVTENLAKIIADIDKETLLRRVSRMGIEELLDLRVDMEAIKMITLAIPRTRNSTILRVDKDPFICSILLQIKRTRNI